ncbi:hypothetical protein LF1_14710 [Rubripirellula obstinata]|uniref:Uncharacterized protein n=1 Tax=Rubripirellula obstinata TaxID=406547 RepID=A0A5B1CCU0_9BACT|nr:hypothetical protein [Rubripirellula obstinata]KAA1258947.1 hypothetical protein LF1_14710 [Rubripirellula obstinata]
MKLSEWTRIAKSINADIAGLTLASRLRNDVRNSIQQSADDPTEEHFIDEDSFGHSLFEPFRSQHGGAEIKVWKTHRAGLQCSDIAGADLYYEIADRAYVLVQYKKPTKSGRIARDAEQLTTLKNACPVTCPPPHRFRCGSWFTICEPDNRSYFTACEADAIFGQYNSRKAEYFINGLTKEQFLHDFGAAIIGARTEAIDIESYRKSAIAENRVVVNAVRQ